MSPSANRQVAGLNSEQKVRILKFLKLADRDQLTHRVKYRRPAPAAVGYDKGDFSFGKS